MKYSILYNAGLITGLLLIDLTLFASVVKLVKLAKPLQALIFLFIHAAPIVYKK